MIRDGRLWRGDRSGSTAMEFAVAAPVLLLLIFSVLELGRMSWVYQTLQVVGQQTARCVAIGSTACASPASYAATVASAYGVSLDSSDVTVTTTTGSASTCIAPNVNQMVQVTISPAFTSPVAGLLPWLDQTLTTVACYPLTGT